MKILNKIILISIGLFTFMSCTSDDENLFEYVGPETKTITGTLASEQHIVAQDGTITVTYTLPQSFSTDAVLQVKSSLGVGHDSFADITVLAGETTGEFEITLEETVGFAGQKFTVEMTGLKQVIFEDITNDDGDIVSIPTVIKGDDIVVESNKLDFLLLPNYEEGKANFKFGWDDTSDFDVIITDSTDTVVTDSQTGSNPEEFMLEDALADGDYTVKIVYYAIEDDNSNVFFQYRNSQGVVSIVNFELSGYVLDTSAQIPTFTITKTGIDYTITKI